MKIDLDEREKTHPPKISLDTRHFNNLNTVCLCYPDKDRHSGFLPDLLVRSDRVKTTIEVHYVLPSYLRTAFQRFGH